MPRRRKTFLYFSQILIGPRFDPSFAKNLKTFRKKLNKGGWSKKSPNNFWDFWHQLSQCIWQLIGRIKKWTFSVHYQLFLIKQAFWHYFFIFKTWRTSQTHSLGMNLLSVGKLKDRAIARSRSSSFAINLRSLFQVEIGDHLAIAKKRSPIGHALIFSNDRKSVDYGPILIEICQWHNIVLKF